MRSPFSRNIRALRDRKQVSQEELADDLGVSRQTIIKWEKGDVARPRNEEIVELLKESFDVTDTDLFGASDGYYAKLHGLTSAPPGAIAVEPGRAATVPVRVVGSVHAGEPDEGFPEDGEAELLQSLHERHRNCFAVIARGNCMDRAFGSGSVLFADPDMEPVDGSIGVFLVEGEAVVRRLRMGSSTVMLSPESSEAGHRDIIVPADGSVQMECQGVVFWYQACRELG